MTEKNEVDEKALFKRKNNFLGYRFCPRCGRELVKRSINGYQRLGCPDKDCDFVYYHNPIPAAGAVVVKNEKILMVKRSVMPKKGWWCLPAGFMEWSEHPTETAVRELKEETGLDVELRSIFEIYSGQDDPRMNAVLILYLASINGGRLKAGDDAVEVKFFGFDELPEKIAFLSHRQALADYKQRYMK